MVIDGQRAQYLSSAYITNIRRYMKVEKFRPKTYIILPNHTFSKCKMDFVDSLSKNKTIILLNLAEYSLI